MPHGIPGVNIYDDGVLLGRFSDVDFDENLDVTIVDGHIAEVDGSAGGGGSDIIASLDGTPLTATAESFDATEGLFASAIANAVTYSVYGAHAGTLAARPAAARSNKRGFYYATDTKAAYTSDGTTWTNLFTLGTMSSQDASSVSITGGSVTGITDITVADGGTGASTAAGARTNLGVWAYLARTAVKTTTYSAAAGELVPCDDTGGNFTVTLPTAPAEGTLVAIKIVTHTSGNAVTVACGGSDVFTKTGGLTSSALRNSSEGILLQYSTSDAVWTVIAREVPSSAVNANYLAKTANYTAIVDDLVNCTSGTFDVTLPTAVGITGRQIIVKNSGTGVITIKTTSSQTIDGFASAAITLSTQYNSLTFVSDGANWIIV